MIEIDLFFLPDGTVQAAYHDRITELGLGPMKMFRQSSVEFNSLTQLWEARDLNGNLMCSHATREGCLLEEGRLVKESLCRELVGNQC